MDISTDDFPTYYSHETFLTTSVFKAAMSRKWNEVLALFRDNKEVRCQKITRSGDTVLHVAISGATQRIVLQLLQTIENTDTTDELYRILGAKNEDGDTPLHLAAAFGLKSVCYKIATIMPELVTKARNGHGETPLFTAVRHGRKHAFFVLEHAVHELNAWENINTWLSSRDHSHCRRHDGNNILHYAIKGEHFALAYEIMHLYPPLMNYANANGETALHILASKPSAFKSGFRAGFWDRIIYHFAISGPLKLEFNDFIKSQSIWAYRVGDELSSASEVLPTIYNACIDLLYLTTCLISCIFRSSCLGTGMCNIRYYCHDDPENQCGIKVQNGEEQRRIPPNYDVAVSFFKIIVKLLSFALGLVLGIRQRQQMFGKLKQKNRNAETIMKELVDQLTLWEYEDTGGMKPEAGISQLPHYCQMAPPQMEDIKPDQEQQQSGSKATHGLPSLVLVAAKTGITEMVERILDRFPVAIFDRDEDEKNIVLLAAEHRQVHVYNFMLNISTMKEKLFGHVDNKGNSALHLAAKFSQSHSWSIQGAALQMQFESNWYKYVRNSVEPHLFANINNEGKTAQEVFIESHEKIMKEGNSWLTNTVQYCAVVTALIATVAFEAASQVPGHINQESGFQGLIRKPAFLVYAISAILALCSSITSLILFLAILTSGYQAMYFDSGLPVKLILGLTSLYMSIASMLVSLCAGNLFIVGKNLNFAAYPIYAFMCLLARFFAISTQPLYTVMLYPVDFF